MMMLMMMITSLYCDKTWYVIQAPGGQSLFKKIGSVCKNAL